MIKNQVNKIASKGKEKNIIFFNVNDCNEINDDLSKYVLETIKSCNVVLPEDHSG